jgi:hypothetical protein
VVQDPVTRQESLRAIIARDAKGNVVKNNVGKPQVDPGFYKFMALEFIGNVSLNRVTVTVAGTMAVDVKAIAAGIHDVAIDKVTDCGTRLTSAPAVVNRSVSKR